MYDIIIKEYVSIKFYHIQFIYNHTTRDKKIENTILKCLQIFL